MTRSEGPRAHADPSRAGLQGPGAPGRGPLEDLCRRCGISCHPAVQVGRLKVVLPGVHCRHLRHDAGGATHCSVYARRFEVAPWCLSAEQARRENLLATDCPHHAAASAGAAPAAVDPLGKTRLHPRLLARIAPAVARSLVEHGVPGWVSLPGVLGFLEGAGFDVRSQAVGPDGRRRFEVAERSSGPGATPRPSEDR